MRIYLVTGFLLSVLCCIKAQNGYYSRFGGFDPYDRYDSDRRYGGYFRGGYDGFGRFGDGDRFYGRSRFNGGYLRGGNDGYDSYGDFGDRRGVYGSRYYRGGYDGYDSYGDRNGYDSYDSYDGYGDYRGRHDPYRRHFHNPYSIYGRTGGFHPYRFY